MKWDPEGCALVMRQDDPSTVIGEQLEHEIRDGRQAPLTTAELADRCDLADRHVERVMDRLATDPYAPVEAVDGRWIVGWGTSSRSAR